MSETMLILIRSIISFIVLLLLTRLMGKKQISQMTFFDYVVGITIGSIAASMSIDQNIMLANGLIGLAIWGLIPILISIVSLKSNIFRTLTDGSPTVLVENGKILENNLAKEELAIDQLLLLLRQKNAFKLSDVEFAVLENDGQLSVLKKSSAQPVTPSTLGIKVEQEKEPRLVIADGTVMELTLQEMGYTKAWLLDEIRKQGASGFSDVFLGQLEASGKVYVDLYETRTREPMVDPLKSTRVKENLAKVYGELSAYSLETEDPVAKRLYQEEAKRIQQVLTDLADNPKE